MDLGIYATIVLQMAASYRTWVIPRPFFSVEWKRHAITYDR